MPGVLADVQAANASLDQTVQKKKFRDRQDIKSDIMTNLLYALTDHDHTENELTPWLAECVWGHWEYAAGSPIHPYANPEYLKVAEESLWRWND